MVPEPVPAVASEVAAADRAQPIPHVSRSTIQWSKAFPAAALAGLLSALSMFLPYGSFGLGMVLAGYFCVVLYRRRTFGAIATRGLGAKLGAATGFLGFIIFSLWTAVQVAFLHTGGEIREQLMKAVEQSAAGNPDPNVQAAVAQLKSPEGLAVMMALGLFVTMLGLVVLGSIGGAAAGSPRPRHQP
jgi:hypothetical protein